MRSSTILVLAASILTADAITLRRRSDGAAPRVVQHGIHRRSISDPVSRDRARMQKRATGTVSVSLLNEETLYYMNATLGTPAQSFELHIDTGSSDLWVNTASSTYCEQSSNECSLTGLYSANKSSTYKYLNSDFNISYVDGSGSSGDYATDTLTFGGVTLADQQFGIGYVSSSSQGVLGIGYSLLEVEATSGDGTYANVPQHLVNNGDISANAYSLWLNDLNASTGSILFGGVNTAKYTAPLLTVPIIKEQGVYAEFIIALTSIGANSTSTTSLASSLSLPALLDSGTSLMYLPDTITNSIYSSLDLTYNSNAGAPIVPCSYASTSSSTLDFTFSYTATIRVALRDLVIPIAVSSRGQETCIFGIGYSDDSLPVLGDTFLRSAYVVYDLSSNEISLAQTEFGSGREDDVLEITTATVPGASMVPTPVTSVAALTGGGGVRETGVVTSKGVAPARETAGVGSKLALVGAVGAGVLFAL